MRRSSTQKVLAPSKVYSVNRANPSSFVGKVQGKDVFKSTVKSNFINTVMDLKNKHTNKSTQEQYINGLQEQIKFLEYELKLLKDKQVYERQGIQQLDNFLKDEIPINQNILAMKNKYNNTKMSLQSKYKKLVQEDSQAKKVLLIQNQQIRRLNSQIQNNGQQLKNRQMKFKDQMTDISEQMTKLQSQYDKCLEDTKKKQLQLKKMNEQMQTISRQYQKEKVIQVRKDDQAMRKLFKMITDFVDNQQQYVQSIIKMQQLASYDDRNPLATPIENQNILFKKRLMVNEKQKNTHQNRISELDLYLSEKARDRQIQRQLKQKILNRVFDAKNQINTIEREIDDLVKVQLNIHKSYKVKTIIDNTDEKKRNIQFFSSRLRKLEQECNSLIQDKKQLYSHLDYEKDIKKAKTQKVDDLNNKILKFKSSIEGIKKYKQIVQKQIPPIKTDIEKFNLRIPVVQRQIQRKKQQLQYMSKQVQLVKQLKSLDLQEMKMVSTGTNQIQNSLSNFIKKWEKIKMSNKAI